jgi:glycyl-tRNA synthetase beta chain
VRRGNEWVVVGRLDDARFFWDEDRKRSLASRVDDLKRVTFHKKLGSYEEKTRRIGAISKSISFRLELNDEDTKSVADASLLAKADLVTGLVGEFPELQGIVGGLLLRAEGASSAVAEAVADHYKPAGARDSIPSADAGCVVAVADRLDTLAGLFRSGETPTGSRDPFGLRRAASGVFRILSDRAWPLSMSALSELTGQNDNCSAFLQDRLNSWLEDSGFGSNEIWAVRRPKVSPTDFDQWPIGEILSRLRAVATLRGRADFAKLVELTKRVDNILGKQPEVLDPAYVNDASFEYPETHESAMALGRTHAGLQPRVLAASAANDFPAVISHLSELVEPVAKFFDDVLVLDPTNPGATRWRCELLAKIRTTVTRDFDIRELAGQADSNR